MPGLLGRRFELDRKLELVEPRSLFSRALLSGVVLGLLAIGELVRLAFARSEFRDKVRALLDSRDGYPFVFCRECGAMISTAPPDEDDEETEP
jgi:hypothetical protein